MHIRIHRAQLYVFFTETDKLLVDAAKDIVDIDDIDGGVYMVYVGGFTVLDTKREHDLVLMKFGECQDFESRYNHLGFDADVVFELDGGNNMESWFKKRFIQNFSKKFWPRAKVKTIQAFLKMKLDPGVTDWRILKVSTVNAIKKLDLNSFNYKLAIQQIMPADPVLFERGRIALRVNKTRKTLTNKIPLRVY